MKTKIIITIVLSILAILKRTVFHFAPNVELVTALGISAGYLWKDKPIIAFGIPLIIMAFTDSIIGNTSIFLFTWSAFLAMPVLGKLLAKYIERYPIVFGLGTGLIGSIVFFLWTNFGVVLTTNMYSKDIAGLIQSYINGLPFFRNQLLGNLVFVPIVLFLVNYSLKTADKFAENSKNLLENSK